MSDKISERNARAIVELLVLIAQEGAYTTGDVEIIVELSGADTDVVENLLRKKLHVTKKS